MVSKVVVVLVVYFSVSGYLPQALCWKRGGNNVFFEGAVFSRRNFALETDILKKVKTSGEFQCGFACLSEKDCIAQTYCTEAWDKSKGTCYLHKNGIKDELTAARVLMRRDRCIFHQYINFYEVCSRQCHNGNKCDYDHNNRRYTCRCDPPYYGMYCENIQALSFRFTTLGMQGSSGPISTAGYANTSLYGTVTLNRGIQIWTVPFTASYNLTVAGASGGDAFSPGGKLGGKGAIISGVVRINKGIKLHILIGQKGLNGTSGAGGGGGTFVVFSNNTPLAVAGGGGGGGGQDTAIDGDNGQTGRNGSVYGGIGGLGGRVCANKVNDAGGGGGFQGNGDCSYSISCHPRTCKQAGKSYLNGGLGGTGNGNGGFGGGGAADNDYPGGGGGYSGGGVYVSAFNTKGGGGGSYYTGDLKPIHEVNNGDGYVVIDYDGSSAQ